MRFILKVLSILIISGATGFSVVACKRTSDNGGSSNNPPDNKPVIYNVLFKEVTSVDGVNFKVSNLYERQFLVKSENVVGASNLPSNFYDDTNRASLYVDNQQVWDQIGKVYDFDMTTDRFRISDIMADTSIINVSMRIRLGSYPWPTGNGVWVVESFSAQLNKK